MNAVDTNVLIYRFDRDEAIKRRIAHQLLEELSSQGHTVLLWQVAGELQNQFTRWFHEKRIRRSSIALFIAEVQQMFPLAMPTPACLDHALEIAERHSLSHWDSMLLAACLEAGVTALYTEDMGAPRKIDSLELINPFLAALKAS